MQARLPVPFAVLNGGAPPDWCSPTCLQPPSCACRKCQRFLTHHSQQQPCFLFASADEAERTKSCWLPALRAEFSTTRPASYLYFNVLPPFLSCFLAIPYDHLSITILDIDVLNSQAPCFHDYVLSPQRRYLQWKSRLILSSRIPDGEEITWLRMILFPMACNGCILVSYTFSSFKQAGNGICGSDGGI